MSSYGGIASKQFLVWIFASRFTLGCLRYAPCLPAEASLDLGSLLAQEVGVGGLFALCFSCSHESRLPAEV
jgi:hypothetical protein